MLGAWRASGGLEQPPLPQAVSLWLPGGREGPLSEEPLSWLLQAQDQRDLLVLQLPLRGGQGFPARSQP